MTWFREMLTLWREYRQACRDEKEAIAAISAEMQRKYDDWYRIMDEADEYLAKEYNLVNPKRYRRPR